MKASRAWRRAGCAATFAALALGAGPAQAHLNSTGIGPVYDGLMHFLTSPADIVPVVALALLAGLRGSPSGRRAVIVLPTAWFLGSLFGLLGSARNESLLLSSFWFLLLGGLVLANAKVSPRGITVLAALLGLTHGYLNGAGVGASAFAFTAVFGLAAAVFVSTVLTTALVVQLRANWAQIAVRVAGSWIAASGLLMLGWAARGG